MEIVINEDVDKTNCPFANGDELEPECRLDELIVGHGGELCDPPSNCPLLANKTITIKLED